MRLITDLSHFNEHPAYILGDKITDICAPLFNNFTINHFDYSIRYLKSDKNDMPNIIAIAGGDKNWFRHYLQSDYNFLYNGRKTHSWQSVMSSEALEDAATNFNHYNGIIFEKVNSEYIEFFGFASPNECTPVEFCSNKKLLNQFILYFKDKARDILKTIEKEPICFPKSRFLNIEDSDQPYTEFCQAIRIRKLPLRFRTQEVIFSQREFDILSLLVKGKTMREIASILKISPRTVETYIYTAKDKTNTFTTSRLLDLFADSLF